MIVIPFAVVLVGYDLLIWGRCLVKGWDITLWQLSNPVKPYQWPVPPQTPPTIAQGKIWPSGTAATSAAPKGGRGGTVTAD